MTDRGFYSQIERVIRDGKRRIADSDRLLVGQILQEYEAARTNIGRELMNLERQILWSIENNDDVITDAWIRRQEWYQYLDESIEREVARLERGTRRLTAHAHSTGATEAVGTYRATVDVAPFMRQVNVPAIERWTASIQSGSPLDRVLTKYGTNVDTVLRREITQGIIHGQGKQSIVNEIMLGVGESMSEYEASRIVRNEMMRTYRGVYQDQLDALTPGMIIGYRRLAALDSRTCVLCIALHNQITDDPPDDFHVQDRCVVVPVFSPRYAPPPPGGYPPGDEWLREQPIERQHQALGAGERFELWQSGTPLTSMVEIEHDPEWGGSPRLIPMRRLQP